MSTPLTFAAQVSDWVRESENRLTAVFRESTQDVIAEMQKVGPSVASTKAAISEGIGTTGRGRNKKQKAGPAAPAGEGGNMPVDTGFLRASLRVTKDSPLGMTAASTTGVAITYSDAAAALVIGTAEIGDTLYASYTAKYAARINYGFAGTDSLGREYNQRGYQFVGLAAQKWPQIVSAVVARLTSASTGAK